MKQLDESPYMWFLGGTLVLEHVDAETAVPPPFTWINAKWRCPAVHYRTVKPWLEANKIGNSVPRWQTLNLRLHDGRSPHDYQLEALKAWQGNGRWGSVVLPTGSGKTFLALRAIAETRTSTLVVVPTIDLLHQWYGRLENAFKLPIGVWYGLEKNAQSITVTTYASAWANGEILGNQFKLVIFDEIHHLPAPSWHEIALMSAAPFRLGLTATYPDTYDELPPVNSRPLTENRIQLLEDLVGPVLYRKTVNELSGNQLANYRTERIRINLTPTERTAYDDAYNSYTGYMREARLRERFGSGWWQELTRRSAYEQDARRAKVSELKLKEIVHQAEEKMNVVDQLLREHTDSPILVFTAHNRFAYAIARRQLIPAITHQTKAAERKAILDGFRNGTYRAIVTSKVLNEGIDVPEAKVAIVLGGSSNAREYVQRLGRILRKKGNLEAILYEVIARDTVDEGMAQRRRTRVKYHL
ncbi:MAG: DEAD/DEAH box helicase [Chloroflexi bacterium]|nr:DEAD/DEAH box helicase [Chloroflexota bacterium]